MIDNEYNSAVCNATTGVGGQNHCGAGITLGDFKLLVGFPGNDGWPQPPEATEATASAPECGAATFLNDTCLHIFVGQLRNFTCASASSCCAACAQDVRCGSWSPQQQNRCPPAMWMPCCRSFRRALHIARLDALRTPCSYQAVGAGGPRRP